MKKAILAVALMASAGLASAAEIGVQGLRDYGTNPDRNGFGITVGQKFGAVTATAGFDRFTKGTNDLDRYSLVGGVDVAKLGPVTVAVKAGVAYLDPQTSSNGYALLAGAGVSYPLTKKVALTADYRYQHGQDRVSQFNGSTIGAGVKVSF